MSCALALLAAFTLSHADAAAAAYPTEAAAVAVASAPSFASEPLFAEIVSRSQSLKTRVDAWAAGGAAIDAPVLRQEVTQLALLNGRAHRDLHARGADRDLACMLGGMANDLPLQLQSVESAANEDARKAALRDLGALLDDNVVVIQAPSRPPV